jgi:hypothetical protein
LFIKEDAFCKLRIYICYTQASANYFEPFEENLSTQELNTSDFNLSHYNANQYGLGIKFIEIFTKQ